jgi:hypothetical protein
MQRLMMAIVVLLATGTTAIAQDERRAFAGVLVGVSTLSADGRAVTSLPEAMISLYKPENGGAVNALAGFHLTRFLTLQGNYVWNRNDLTLVSSTVSPLGSGVYEQQRRSAQHAGVGDLLVYFRPLGSAIRPYLGTGLCVFRFASPVASASMAASLEPPSGEIRSTKVALRSHVGIDFALSPRLAFRYSFSETISRNPISPHLAPPGQRPLANFQNLFGIVSRF